MKDIAELYSGRKLEETKKVNKCDCLPWINSMHLIEGAQVLAMAHGFLYEGEVFVFCPWCGKKLEQS